MTDYSSVTVATTSPSAGEVGQTVGWYVTLQSIQGDTQICNVITNMKQVNLSAHLRFLVYTIRVRKHQNMKSGMQPLMAEEKDMRKAEGVWTAQKGQREEARAEAILQKALKIRTL